MFDNMVSEKEKSDKQEEAKTERKEKKAEGTTIEKQLKDINEQLSHVVKKDDRTFLRELIKDIFSEMIDTLMASLTRRIDVLEGDVHTMALENESLKKEVVELKQQIEAKHEEMNDLKKEKEIEKLLTYEKLNDQEQYSRKNSIRLTSLPDDNMRETPWETAGKVVGNLNYHLNINLSEHDIDIAHRLGKFRHTGKGRAVIVKFVQRTTKQMVLANRKYLKGSVFSAFEDLTRLNAEILACTKKKAPNEVKDSWTRDGKFLSSGRRAKQ